MQLPPARPRYRDGGLSPLDWANRPTADEAQVDNVRLKISGTVEWDGSGSFAEYISYVAGGIWFGAAGGVGKSYRSSLRGLRTLAGDLSIRMRSPGAADVAAEGQAIFELELSINPTTTRALVMRRATGPLASLSPSRFFSPLPTPDEAFPALGASRSGEMALDGAENILLGLKELGGTSPATRRRSRDEFLAIYEAQLKALVMQALCPPFLKPAIVEEGCRATTDDGRFRVFLDWHRVLVQRAELYWERKEPQSVAVVQRLASRGLELARRIKARTYDGTAFFEEYRADGSVTMAIPLTGERNIELAVYAKSPERVRFEVRYQRDFGRHLKSVPAANTGRLPALLVRLAENGAKRLPWAELGAMANLPQAADRADIPVLIGHLVTASGRVPNLMGPLVHGVMNTGGVFAHEDRFPGIGKAIKQLVRLGVLERSSFQMKEQRTGRRYALTPRFSAVRRKMLRGFAPEENAPSQYGLDDEEDGHPVGVGRSVRATQITPVAGSGRSRRL